LELLRIVFLIHCLQFEIKISNRFTLFFSFQSEFTKTKILIYKPFKLLTHGVLWIFFSKHFTHIFFFNCNLVVWFRWACIFNKQNYSSSFPVFLYPVISIKRQLSFFKIIIIILARNRTYQVTVHNKFYYFTKCNSFSFISWFHLVKYYAPTIYYTPHITYETISLFCCIYAFAFHRVTQKCLKINSSCGYLGWECKDENIVFCLTKKQYNTFSTSYKPLSYTHSYAIISDYYFHHEDMLSLLTCIINCIKSVYHLPFGIFQVKQKKRTLNFFLLYFQIFFHSDSIFIAIWIKLHGWKDNVKVQIKVVS
jgi:hypothetical protein